MIYPPDFSCKPIHTTHHPSTPILEYGCLPLTAKIRFSAPLER